MNFDSITIRTIDNGYEVTFNSVVNNAENYTPTLGMALEDAIYRILKAEGSDVPEYVKDGKIVNEKDASEVLQSLFVFAKTFFYRAVKTALEENAEELKRFEEKEAPA